ncbi:nitrate- and nitrite sensing domain-containing protein, partial [Campylobacter gastrosuis]
MNNLSIKQKMLLVVLSSVLSLLLFSIYTINGFLNKRTEAETSAVLVDDIIHHTDFIHEFQKERGLSAAFVNGVKNGEKLNEQRALTDKTLTFLSQNLKERVSGVRSEVDAMGGGAAASFTKVIRDENILINAYTSSLDPSLVDDFKMAIVVGDLKEFLGITRATLNGILAKGIMDKTSHDKLNTLFGILQKLKNDFLDFNEKSVAQQFSEKILNTSEYLEVDKILKDTLNVGFGEATNYKPNEWFALATSLIDKVRVYEISLYSNIKDKAIALKSTANTNLIKAGFGIGFCILVVILLSFIIGKRLVNDINQIANGLKNFFDFLNFKTKEAKPLTIKSHDELGVMATLINENIAKVEQSTNQDNIAVSQSVDTAKQIENGNLKARITQNPANPGLIELKNVLNKMLDTLELKVGSDLNEIQKVFNSYRNSNFTSKIQNPKGEVEMVTNALGDEISNMLRT